MNLLYGSTDDEKKLPSRDQLCLRLVELVDELCRAEISYSTATPFDYDLLCKSLDSQTAAKSNRCRLRQVDRNVSQSESEVTPRSLFPPSLS